MSLTTWFGWGIPESAGDATLPDIFPLKIKEVDFIQTDIVEIYSKILTDVVERVSGLDDDTRELLWDNCLESSSRDGLISMLAKAMSDKKELFIVYDEATNVLRYATFDEQQKIRADYKTASESSIGTFVSFKNYTRSDMIKLYSGLEYATVGALNKSMNLSKSIQLKMSNLRGGVALSDSAGVTAQAKAIAKGLGQGQDVMLDKDDMIVTAMPDLTSVKASIEFLDSKRSFYLGLPEAYINGVQTGGLGTTGENDTKAIERGLRSYYFSIIKPVLESVFDVETKYKSQDFRQIGQALEALKTFALVDNETISADEKRTIIAGLLDLQTEVSTGDDT